MSKTPIDHHTRIRTRSLTRLDRISSRKIHPNPSDQHPASFITEPLINTEAPNNNNSKATKRKSKHLTENSPSSPEPNSAKKPATEMAVTLNEIQMLLEKHNSSIADTIRSTVHSELHAFGEQLKSDINNKIAEINTKIDDVKVNVNVQSEQLAVIQSSVNNCMERININEDDCIRIAKLNELKVRGIPLKDGENLQTIFAAIAKQVGFDLSIPNNVPELNRVRISSSDKVSSQPPTIFVKFVAQHIRDKFYSLYINTVKTKPLKTEHIGMEQGGRIYFGEVLTVNNQKIFVNAMRYKRDNKLAKLYTKNGLVTVKKSSDSRPTTIRSSRELDIFIASNTPAVQSVPSTLQSNNETTTTPAIDASNVAGGPAAMETDK